MQDEKTHSALIEEVSEAIGQAVDGFDGQGKYYLVEAEAAIRATFRFYRQHIPKTMVEAGAEALGGYEWQYKNDKPRFRDEAKQVIEAAFAEADEALKFSPTSPLKADA